MQKGKLISFNTLLILLLLAVVLGLYLFNRELAKNKYDIKQYKGVLVSIDGNKVIINGNYVPGNGKSLPANLAQSKKLTFKVDSSTQFHKTTIRMPTPEELESGEMEGVEVEVLDSGAKVYRYKFENIPRSYNDGSLNDLAESLKQGSVLLEVNFPVFVDDEQYPIASSINYEITFSKYDK